MIDEQLMTERKAEGFLTQKDKEHFAVRVVPYSGTFSWEELEVVQGIARDYGTGVIGCTQRAALEVPGILPEFVDAVKERLDQAGIRYGGTGRMVRPLVCCKGTYCRFGMIDTQQLCRQLDLRFYGEPVPHKLKINICGCPNNCTKVQLNDIGIMPMGKKGFRLFVGGRAGREIMKGQQIGELVEPDRLEPVIQSVIEFYRKHGKTKERLAQMLSRLKEEDSSFSLENEIDI